MVTGVVDSEQPSGKIDSTELLLVVGVSSGPAGSEGVVECWDKVTREFDISFTEGMAELETFKQINVIKEKGDSRIVEIIKDMFIVDSLG